MFLVNALKCLQNKVTSKAQQLLLTVLAAGPIPKHVAFVMDGNRRYARNHQKRVFEGHQDGFFALRRMLEICLRLDIKCVSAYAFSIENFKRSPEEVDALMGLAEEKLVELCEHGDLLDQYGVRLNVIGRIDMLPEQVQSAVRKAERMTLHNDRAIFNLCLPYTSRDEMATAIQNCVREVIDSGSDKFVTAFKNNSIPPDAPARIITEDDIDGHLMTSKGGSPPVDILIRTSGVKRLSDFLLWQVPIFPR